MMKLAFYKGRRGGLSGLFDTLVRWWTNGPYSHVELVFSDDISASASMLDNGVRFKKIEWKPDRWDFFEIEGNEELAKEWFLENVGSKYDYLGLFGFIYRKHTGDCKRWFCSEACAKALGYKDAWRFCPNTLYAIITRENK
jgi:hypothetical protein